MSIRVQLLAVAASAIVACASPVSDSDLPDCGSESALQPLPTPDCRSSPDVIAYENDLGDLLARDAGPLLLRIQFGTHSAIQAVCADRSIAKNQWRPRARIASKLAAAYALPSGPACLAGKRIDLNRLSAGLAEVDSVLEKCGRDATARLESDRDSRIPPDVASSNAGRVFRTCLDRNQNRRNEIWVFASVPRKPHIFRKTERSAARRTALLACTDAQAFHEVFDALTGVALDAATMTRCMQEHGWEPLQ